MRRIYRVFLRHFVLFDFGVIGIGVTNDFAPFDEVSSSTALFT
jgi:hypothetical protein